MTDLIKGWTAGDVAANGVTPMTASEAVALWSGGEVAHIAETGHCIHTNHKIENRS